MQTTLDHLPAPKQALLQELKSHLLEHYQEEYGIEQIVLFGSYATGKWKANRYVDKAGNRQEYISDMDILVVTQGEKKAQRLEMQVDDRLALIEGEEPISIIAHSATFINKELKDHNYFFATIRTEGILLYDSGNYTWPASKQLSKQRRHEKAQEAFDKWFVDGNDFVKGYSFYFEEKLYKKAAFLLHQATECYYKGVLEVFTGYAPRGHDLKVLSPKVAELHPSMRDAFPRRTDEDKRLFTLLKQAYTHARYKKNWTITPEDLTTLAASVEKLRACVEQCCQAQLAYLAQQAQVADQEG